MLVKLCWFVKWKLFHKFVHIIAFLMWTRILVSSTCDRLVCFGLKWRTFGFIVEMWESADDNYDDDRILVMSNCSSVKCPCAKCQQRHHMLTIRHSNVISLLPGDDAEWSSYLQTHIDRSSLKYLNKKCVINWCSSARKLYPCKTTGNCRLFERNYWRLLTWLHVFVLLFFFACIMTNLYCGVLYSADSKIKYLYLQSCM